MREFLARKKVGANAIKSLTKRVTELSREAGHQDDITFDEDAILEFNDDSLTASWPKKFIQGGVRELYRQLGTCASHTARHLVKDGDNAKAADHIRNIKSASRTRLFRKLKVINPNEKKKNKRKSSDGDEIGSVKKKSKYNSLGDEDEDEDDDNDYDVDDDDE